MSYTVTTNPDQSAIDTAFASLLTQECQSSAGYTHQLPDTLVARLDPLRTSGQTVMLDTGQTVWCSCVAADDPTTIDFEFAFVAIEFVGGKARTRANGRIVGMLRYVSLPVDLVHSYTSATVRKAGLMLALGEPQPQVPIPTPAEGGPTEQDMLPMSASDAANMSIRSQISVADALEAPPEDVL